MKGGEGGNRLTEGGGIVFRGVVDIGRKGAGMMDQQAMKRIVVKLTATGKDATANSIGVEPGTTSEDVLSYLGFDKGYNLFAEGGHKFELREDLYKTVQNGEVLYVTPEAVVGR